MRAILTASLVGGAANTQQKLQNADPPVRSAATVHFGGDAKLPNVGEWSNSYSDGFFEDRDNAVDQLMQANSGHWRCWVPVLRDFHLGYIVRSRSVNDLAGDIGFEDLNATYASGRLELSWQHAHLIYLLGMNGLPISFAYCHPGVPDSSQRLALNSMTAEMCCGQPILPKRCDGSEREFVLEVDVNNYIFHGGWRTGIEDRYDCASLDEFSLYFGTGTAFNTGSDKDSSYHDYLRFVEMFLSRFGSAARVLEIGVNQGHSLALWSMWFPDGEVLGVDINPKVMLSPQLVARGANYTGNARIMIANAASPEFLGKLSLQQHFDVIVDDASHLAEDQITSFEMLFPSDHLVPGGIYWIEDVWDVAAWDYFTELSRYFISQSHSLRQFAHEEDLRAEAVRDWRVYIHSISFRNQMVLIEKRSVGF